MKVGVSLLTKSTFFSDGETFTINECLLLNLRYIPLMLLATSNAVHEI